MEREVEDKLAAQQAGCQAARASRGSGGGWGLWWWGRQPGTGAEEGSGSGADRAPADAANSEDEESEDEIEEKLVAQQAGCTAARGSGGGWGLWRWGAEEGSGKSEADLATADGEEGTAAGRWQWLRGLTAKTVGAGTDLLKQMGESHYQRMCVDKFHRDRVRFNKARAALALQRGEVRRPHRSRGVSEHACQDAHRIDLTEDAVCARAVELVYEENDDMVACMKREFAEHVILPGDVSGGGTEDEAGEWKTDPKWVVVALKHGMVRGGLQSEGALVIFRGTHSWEDTMHDLLCVPVEHDSGVLLHRGVALAVSRTAPTILKALELAMRRLTSPRVIFTGHSYGVCVWVCLCVFVCVWVCGCLCVWVCM